MATGTAPAGIRIAATVLNMLTKYGPTIIGDITELFSLFEGSAKTAAPAAVATATDLNAAASTGTVSLMDVKDTAAKHGLSIDDAGAKQLHQVVQNAA